MRWGQKSRKRTTTRPGWQETRDEVTGLVTYPGFVTQVGAAVTSRTFEAQPAVLLIDIEGVNEAVDLDEHTAGDDLTRMVASRVSREVGSLGVLGRMNDHQFGVLFPTLTSPAVALDLAYRIVSGVSAPFVLKSLRQIQLSTSLGLVTWDSMGPRATADDLLRGAGLAVREARRAGRNHIEVCTAELIAVADETLAIGKDLRKALDEKGLRVCYQPLVDLTHGSIAGVDLTNAGFVAMVEECLNTSGLPSDQLVLEVTESAVERQLEVARERFDSLHDLGVRVALDDFGTGRSALAYLQTLAVDILKVDRSYLDAVDEHRADDLLRGVIGLGQALGMEVYGEGIEDEAQSVRLRRNGCDIGQGYLFARPLPTEDAAVYLRRQAAPASVATRHG